MVSPGALTRHSTRSQFPGVTGDYADDERLDISHRPGHRSDSEGGSTAFNVSRVGGSRWPFLRLHADVYSLHGIPVPGI